MNGRNITTHVPPPCSPTNLILGAKPHAHTHTAHTHTQHTHTHTHIGQVVATIHQPNSLIVDLWDDFLLLAKGRTMYSGPWAGALPYFEAAGHPSPTYVNPTGERGPVEAGAEGC